MKAIPKCWKVGKVKGKLKYDQETKKVIVEFPFPKGERNLSASDIHIFQDRAKELKLMAERAYQAIEYIGREFYTRGDHTIQVDRHCEGVFTVNILI